MNALGQARVYAERTIAEHSRLLLEIDGAIVSQPVRFISVPGDQRHGINLRKGLSR